jgi:hypothetical protein
MTVAFAALHRRLLYRGEETTLYAVALEDGTMFFSRHQPPLYDKAARLIAPREVLPGSYVNVRYREERGRKWMEAVQVVKTAEDQSPFDPILDDGHL